MSDRAAREAIREAFVSALGTSLKISAGLILLGPILSMALMRKTSPADAAPVPPVPGAPPPRPAARRVTA